MSVYALSQCAELFSGAEKGLHDFQSSLSQKQPCHLVHQGLVTEVGLDPCDPLHVPRAQDFTCASEGDDTSDSEEGITTSGRCNLQLANLAEKCLSKSPTSPASGKMKSCLASPEDVDDLNEHLGTVLDEIFLEGSNPLPLLSAMKGSREKSGASPRKLTVKWAPDVYDPPPTIVSHSVVRGKKQHKSRKEKKHWKDKKKGGGSSSRGTNTKDSRGTNTKDKKQYRKTSGSPNKCYNARDRVGNEFHAFDDDGGFADHSPDSYCGSSFLKKSLDKVHYSLAEAS